MTTPAQKANFPCESSEALTLLLLHVRQCSAVLHLQADRTSAAACPLLTSTTARIDFLGIPLSGWRKESWTVKLNKTSSVLLHWFWDSLMSSYQILKKTDQKKEWGKRHRKISLVHNPNNMASKIQCSSFPAMKPTRRSNSDTLFSKWK